MTDAKKGSPVAKAGLLIILIGAAGFGGWNYCDSKTVEQGNAMRHGLAVDLDLLRADARKEPVDEAGIEKTRADLANMVAKNGGQFGPSFVLRDELKKFTGETKLNAAALTAVASLLAGKVDQADADVKTYRAAQASLAGVAAPEGSLDAHVGQIEKLVGEMKKAPAVEQKLMIAMFRLGFAASSK